MRSFCSSKYGQYHLTSPHPTPISCHLLIKEDAQLVRTTRRKCVNFVESVYMKNIFSRYINIFRLVTSYVTKDDFFLLYIFFHLCVVLLWFRNINSPKFTNFIRKGSFPQVELTCNATSILYNIQTFYIQH